MVHSDRQHCRGCLEKQRTIDQLRAENIQLKAQLRYQERTAKEGPFGSSTPSSKAVWKSARPGEGAANRDIPDTAAKPYPRTRRTALSASFSTSPARTVESPGRIGACAVAR